MTSITDQDLQDLVDAMDRGPARWIRESPDVSEGDHAHRRPLHSGSRQSEIRAAVELVVMPRRATRKPSEADRSPTDGIDRAQIRRMLALTPRERIRHMTEVTNGMVRLRGVARHDRT
jgi:hypothetical protein